MSDPVETVARAINAAGKAWIMAKGANAERFGWADVPDEVFARAAIAAMREPTREMIEASCAAWGVADDGGHERGAFEDEWKAVIDSVLEKAALPADKAQEARDEG